MQKGRKLQLGAAVVIANGIVALVAMSPMPAFANPCAQIVRDPGDGGVCGDAYTVCQGWALPGCTVTSASCTPIPPSHEIYICNYN